MVLAPSLFLVFFVAKVMVLWGRPLPVSAWLPFAFLWQDVAAALAFLVVERFTPWKWPVRVLYGAVVLLVAANVSVGRVLSTPLTLPLLRAARGTLSDSITHHATAANLVLTGLIIAFAITVPLLWRGRWARAWIPAALAIAVIGPSAARRVDTLGLERNAVVALARSARPRVAAELVAGDFRTSPFAARETDDLTQLRGSAAGYNVLVVVLESTGAGYLRSWGAAEDPMPNLTALARRSIVFDNAYAVYPESIKGLIAIFASRYPAFDVPAERHAGIAIPSLSTALRAEGYETAIFHSGRFFYLGMDEVVQGLAFGRAEDAGHISGNQNSSFGVDEAAAVRHVLDWMDTLPAGQRFLAAYLPIAGHHPYAYTARGPFPDDEEVDRYRNALHEGDVALGAMLDGLKQRGLDRNTVIIVMGDHGEAFGQHPGNYGHNLAIYEENVRVPLLIALPRNGEGMHVRRVASLLDVAPTTLDLLGVNVPDAFQGASLLQPGTRMALFFTDYSLGLLGLRDECTKFIHELESDRSRVFDLCRDPDERQDLAAAHAERVARYRELLRQWSAAQVARITGDP
jgi:hypothetical protein